MSNTSSHTDRVVDQGQEALEYARQYAHQRIELLKLDAAEKIAKAIGSLVFMIIVLLLCLSTLAFIFTAAAIYIGILLDSMLMGFGIVALFNLLILITIMTFGKKIILTPLYNIVISAIFED